MTILKTSSATLSIFIVVFLMSMYSNAHFNFITPTKKTVSTIDSSDIVLLVKKGDSLRLNRRYKQAIKIYDQALALGLKSNDSLVNRAGFSCLELYLEVFWDLQKAYDLNTLLYDHSCNEEDSFGLAKSTYYYGKIWMYDHEDIWALQNFNLALEMLQDADHNYLKWSLYTNRSITLNKINGVDNEQVINDRKKALKLANTLNEIKPKVIANVNYAQNFNLTTIDSTLKYLEIARKSSDRISDDVSNFLVYNNIARAYFQNVQPKKALQVLEDNINFSEISRERFFETHGNCFLTLGEIQKALADYPKAITNLNTARDFMMKYNNWEQVVGITELLVDIYQIRGDENKENDELKKLNKFSQKYYDYDLQKEIAKTKNEKLLKITEKEIQDLTEQHEVVVQEKFRNENISNLLGGFALGFILFMLGRAVISRIRFHELNEKINHSRLKSLRTTMNPEFLSSSFDTLQDLVVKNEEKGAVEYMTKLSGMIRNVMANSDSLYINLVDEIEVLKSYIALEVGSFENSFNLFWEVDEKLLGRNPKIPSMVIKPFVENAIVQGLSCANRDCILKVTIGVQNDHKIRVDIEDNGIGRLASSKLDKKEFLRGDSSLLTRNIKERLQLLRRSKQKIKIKTTDLFDTNGKSSGTHVQLILPMVSISNKAKTKKKYSLS